MGRSSWVIWVDLSVNHRGAHTREGGGPEFEERRCIMEQERTDRWREI